MIRKPTKKELRQYGNLLYLNMEELKHLRENIDSLIKLRKKLLDKELSR